MEPEANATAPVPEAHPTVGIAEGTVLDSGEVVVYDRNVQGDVIGWHKEAQNNG